MPVPNLRHKTYIAVMNEGQYRAAQISGDAGLIVLDTTDDVPRTPEQLARALKGDLRHQGWRTL